MKKQDSVKSIFMVVSETYGNEFRKTFKQAEERAKEIYEIEEERSEIHEIVASWSVEEPDIPAPVTIKVDLKDLPI